jgi:hypothetical protein
MRELLFCLLLSRIFEFLAIEDLRIEDLYTASQKT